MPRPKQVPLIRIGDYRRMVALHAHRFWKTLPRQVQVWISIEDMVEDGMYFAYRFHATKYNPNKASFSTSLYHGLHNYFIRHYAELYGAQKKGWEIVDGKRIQISVTSMNMIDRDGEEKTVDEIVSSIPSLHVPADIMIQDAITECFTVPSLVKVYNDASPRLQDEIINWFWFKKQKQHIKSKRFNRITGEFRELCTANSICYDDCLHLVRSPLCMDVLSRQLMGVPFDLNNPCPAADGVMSSTPEWFRRVSHELGTDKCTE